MDVAGVVIMGWDGTWEDRKPFVAFRKLVSSYDFAKSVCCLFLNVQENQTWPTFKCLNPRYSDNTSKGINTEDGVLALCSGKDKTKFLCSIHG